MIVLSIVSIEVAEERLECLQCLISPVGLAVQSVIASVRKFSSANDTHIFFSRSLYWMVVFLPLYRVFIPPFHQIVNSCQCRLLSSAHISWIQAILHDASRAPYHLGYFCTKHRDLDKLSFDLRV